MQVPVLFIFFHRLRASKTALSLEEGQGGDWGSYITI
jgi:hypothetical protein